MPKKERQIVLVVAGNYAQFSAWVREQLEKAKVKKYTHSACGFMTDDTHWINVDSSWQTKGYHGVQIAFVGTWFVRTNAQDIKEALERAKG